MPSALPADRRRRTVALRWGAVGVTSIALLAACSSGTSSSSSSAADGAPASSAAAGSASATSAVDTAGLTATTPAASGPVDQVTWNLPAGEPVSLDPAYTWDTGSGNTVLANVCDTLMRQNPDGSIVPGLAEKVTTPDATTYVYDIRPGVTFTDGTPVTADDVVFSLQRHMDPDTASYFGLWFANVDSITATGPLQVTVTMKTPDVLFGELMSIPAGAVVEKAFAQAAGKDFGTPSGGVMCSGPYSVAEWKAGESITLQANPSYWDSSLKPKASTFVFTFLRDPATITNGLVTGTIDGTWRAPLSGLTQLRAAPNGTLYMNESSFTGSFLMSSFDGALKDVRIRQALQKVIPYQGIVDGVLQGAGAPAAAFATPATWGYARDVFSAAYDKLPPAQQDVAGAQALVDQAGVPSQPIVVAVDAGNQAGVTAVTAIQDAARQIGLDVEIKTFESAAFAGVLFDPTAREGIDMVFVTSTTDIADPLELYAQALPGSPYEWTGFENPAFVDPTTKALAEADPVKRAELVTQGQASFAEQVQVLPVYSPNELLFMSNKITGPPVSSLSSLYYPWAATVGAP